VTSWPGTQRIRPPIYAWGDLMRGGGLRTCGKLCLLPAAGPPDYPRFRPKNPDRHLPRAKCTRCRRPQTAFFGAPAQNTRTPEYHIRRNGILDFSCKNAISGKELGISATRGVSAVSPSAALLPSEPKYASRPRYIRERPKEPREEAVQGAGTVAFVLALGAAASGESDAAEVPPRSGA
jgi:hypothetical protein